jgi:hypothetical protein
MEAVMLYKDAVGRKAMDSIRLFADPGADVATIESRLAVFRLVVASLCNPAIQVTEVAKYTPAGIITIGGNVAVDAPIAIITDKAMCSFGYVGADLTNKVLHLDIPAPNLLLFDQSAHIGITMKPDALQALSDGLGTLTGLALNPIRGVVRTQARKARG